MQYTVIKEISPRKESSVSGLSRFVIVLIAVPVIIIAAVSFLLFMTGAALISLFRKNKPLAPEEPYLIERELLNNDFVEILAIDDERDVELNELNEVWTRNAYHEDTYLYRAKTTPFVAALHNRIVCFYLNEQPGGAVLQILGDLDTGRASVTTELVYLNYSDLQVTHIEELDATHLYNDPLHPDIIRGFNDQADIILRLTAET